MLALRQVRDRLTDCHLVGCQSAPECTNSATSCFRNCFRAVLRPATANANAAGDSCCSEVCAGCAMASKHWTPTTPAATRDASGDRRTRKCVAPRCKWWRSLCTKTFLIVVNLTFLIGGWVIIGLGIWIHVHQDSFLVSYLLKDNPTNPVIVFDKIPFLLIAVGFFVAITGFLGCCGSYADSICFLSFYSILLIIAILAEISIALLVIFCQSQISRKLRASMQYQVQKDYNRTAVHANSTALDVYRLTLAWDTMQIKMNCCGVDGPQDYMHTSWYNHTKDTDGFFVPPSCCVLKNDDLRRPRVANENFCQVDAIFYTSPKNNTDSLGYLKTQGCQPTVVRWLHSYAPQAASILMLLVALEVADLILACILMAWVRKKQSEYWWCEDEDYE